MVVLRKISAASLVETLVASIIIMTVFTLSSLFLNQVFRSTINADQSALENRLYKLEYHCKHQMISLPHRESFKDWEILIEKNADSKWVAITARNVRNDQQLKKQIAGVEY